MVVDARPVSLGRVLTAAALAGAVQVAFVYAFSAVIGLTLRDTARFLGAFAARDPGAMLWTGRIVLAGMAMAWGLLYARVRPALPGAEWQRGLLYGLLIWLASTAVILPLLALVHPGMARVANPGLFGLGFGGLPAAVMSLAAHLVYGTVLGAYVGRGEAESGQTAT